MLSKQALVMVGVVLGLLVGSASAGGQTPDRRGRLVITVIDQTQAVLPQASVTITLQDATGPSASVTASTSAVGLVVFDSLVPGRYTIEASFPGFQTVTQRDVRVRSGDARRTLMLPIQKHDEGVTVSQDKQSASMDPRGSAFSTVLTREQIDALPDDPEEMEKVLKAMAPPGAQFRIDGFTGGRLPPKSQIRSIRLPRLDSFAAQNHGGLSGALFIDIMTMPGAGPLRGSVDVSLLDDALNARNPFTPAKADEQLRQVGLALSGTIKPNKTSFSLSASGGSQYFASNLLAVLPDGTRRAEALRQPTDRYGFSARLDQSLGNSHAARFSFSRGSSEGRNLGVGEFNLPERGYTNRTTSNTLRLSENGPVGRRMFSESRLQLQWSSTDLQSETEAPTLRVNDAFTSGGAQMRGGRRDLSFEFASDLDYVRGNHSWRTGVLLEGGRYRSDDMSNYLGTYTFASLEDYLAGRPAAYSRRMGDPNLAYSYLQAATYVQDDWRALRSLMLSVGVRYGFQSHVSDGWNLSPRLSLAWSPGKNAKTSYRASYGYFYDWVSNDVYRQTLLVDGYRQRELNVRNPAYPEIGLDGDTPPTNRYLWSDELILPTAHRLSAGVERTLSQSMRLSASYSAGWGTNLLRPRNLNAPVFGVRPDPTFANVVEVVADASSRQHALTIGWNLIKLNWRQSFMYASYTLSTSESNTAGPFSLLPSGELIEAEWAPAAGLARHRVSGSFNMQPIRGLSLSLNGSFRTGTPYNVTTGRDDNGDGVFNDRPEGMGRNAARGGSVVDLSGRIAYGWGFGQPRQGVAGPQTVTVGGGGASVVSGGPNARRFRVEVFASASNLLNQAQYGSYSGVMTSPLFGQPTSAGSGRRVQIGTRFVF